VHIGDVLGELDKNNALILFRMIPKDSIEYVDLKKEIKVTEAPEYMISRNRIYFIDIL
jgi:hypothetical protein